MASEPYMGFEPVTLEAALSIQGDEIAMAAFVNVVERFMEEEAPLMAVAADLLSDVGQRLGPRETVEEGMGDYPHRIYITKRPSAAFVVVPRNLGPGDGAGFMGSMVPSGGHLVVAAAAFTPGFRAELAALWGKPLTLLTYGGTEDKHEYEVYEGE